MSTYIQHQAFVTVVELQSLAKAARHLSLSPSAISKQLSALESDLGVTLLERTNRTVQVTAAGRAFYERCKSILAAVDAARREIVEAHSGLAGKIRLTAPAVLTHSSLFPALTEFTREHPEIRLDLHMSDEVEDLIAGRFDFALRLGTLRDNRLRAVGLLETHPVFCASPAYIEHHGRPERLADLQRHSMVLLSTLNLAHAMNRMFNRKGRRAPNLEHFHSTNDINTVHRMVLDGLAIGTLLDCSVHRDLAAGRLIHLFAERQFPGKRLYLVYAKRGTLPKRLALFKDFIKARLRHSS